MFLAGLFAFGFLIYFLTYLPILISDKKEQRKRKKELEKIQYVRDTSPLYSKIVGLRNKYDF